MNSDEPIRVFISVGYGQFHMSQALGVFRSEKFRLVGYLASGYVRSKTIRSLLARISTQKSLVRLSSRHQDISRDLVFTTWLAEGLHQLAQILRRLPAHRITDVLDYLTFRTYQSRAFWLILKNHATIDVYHVRAGFGGRSIRLAQSLGIRVVVDHSIAHPLEMAEKFDPRILKSRAWGQMIHDIDNADILLVNSDYVKETCVKHGFEDSKIEVVYTCVEDSLFPVLQSTGKFEPSNSEDIVFAGALEVRKGFDFFVEIASAMPNHDFVAVGLLSPDLNFIRRTFPKNLKILRPMLRIDFLKFLSGTGIFFFPSRAEGSARVVAEALVAGCYVITTRESGSVTRDGLDGKLIGQGDHSAAIDAISKYLALDHKQRQEMRASTQAFAQANLDSGKYLNSLKAVFSKANQLGENE